jgi:hypothetical protein
VCRPRSTCATASQKGRVNAVLVAPQRMHPATQTRTGSSVFARKLLRQANVTCSRRCAVSGSRFALSNDRVRGVTFEIRARKIPKEEKLRLQGRQWTSKICHAAESTDIFFAFLYRVHDIFVTPSSSPNLIANSLR